jgi:hypothetical protein
MVAGMSRLLLLGLAGLVVGCTSTMPEGTWVGRNVEDDAWLAVKVQEDSAVVYVCGGDHTLATHTRWLAGHAESSTSFEREGWAVDLEIDEDETTGTLSHDGIETAFTATRIPVGGLAGLFTQVTDGCRTGVIVASGDSAGVDAQGAFCAGVNGQNELAQVTPMIPVQQTADGLGVIAATASGDVELFVHELDAVEVAAEIGE